MPIIKSSKLWSTIALIASTLCLGAMIYSVLGVRFEHFSFREASDHLRTVAQVSIFVLFFCAIVAVFSLKNTTSLIKVTFAGAMLLTPLLVLKANMPAGTALFVSAAPTGGMAAPAAGGMAAGGMAAGGMAAGGMAAGGMAAGATQDLSAAPINDISTDTQNPPIFVAVIPLREDASNPADYVASQGSAQAAQFPDIKPISSTLSVDAAFTRALALADDMDWEIVAQDANTGIIEAVASTPFFNFKDDVIIRVSANNAQSIVDIRSHSRIGRGDRGKNAKRVREFIADF